MDPEYQLTACISLKVPFQDADPAGVAWHGNYFRYFDSARVELLEKLDYGYRRMVESGFVWPIIDTRVRYIHPIQYDQMINVEANLLEWEYRLKIGYVIRDADGKRLTKGWTVQVAVNLESGELHLGSPPALLDRLHHSLG